MENPQQQQQAQQAQTLTADAEVSWQEVTPLVEKIWAAVFETTDKMLKVHLKFGFEQFEAQINPTLTNIVFALNVLETLLDAVRSSGALEHSETRMVLNAKQQILLVQQVAEALQAGNKQDYTAAIEKMRSQAGF